MDQLAGHKYRDATATITKGTMTTMITKNNQISFAIFVAS
jgi:hypothetical protein